MPHANKIQQILHKLEQGEWVRWVRLAVILGAVAYVVSLIFFINTGTFRGLSHPKAIDQAQISREIARGNGFSTRLIRPAALSQFQKNKGSFPLERIPDTYHAPLNPYINALVFKVMDGFNEAFKGIALKSGFFESFIYDTTMNAKIVIYTYDKFITGLQVMFFLLAVGVNYFTARRLFDDRLAALSMGMMLLCQLFWDFAISGLPQMLMLFLFSCATHALLRAVEARYRGQSTLLWIILTGVCFGLLALTHGLAIWIFLGALLFTAILFRPRGRDAGIMLGVFLIMYSPWLVRNYQVCGSPAGIGWYAMLSEVGGTEANVMRSMSASRRASLNQVRGKVQRQVMAQAGNIVAHLGRIVAAPVFFIALLHLFKRPETSSFRWCIASMWLFALLGMGIFGLSDDTSLQSNDLHVLFIPLMTFYGLAFLLVMWMRLEINVKLLRISFITLLFVISALPFIQNFIQLLKGPQLKVQWPPYVPPVISMLNTWTAEKEIIMSDMPWAVAWYADRVSLWLPITIKEFVDLNDSGKIKNQIVGLYLTPITGNQPLIKEVLKGEFKEWAPFIMRTVNPRDFPLKAVTALPMDGECIFYADRDRWTTRED